MTDQGPAVSQADPRRILSLIDKVLDVPPTERRTVLEEWVPGEKELQVRVLKAVEGAEADDGRECFHLAAAFQLPEVIGRHQVQRLIAIGGMGELFEARDPLLNRQVIIKVIRNGLDTAESRDRFLHEAKAAGQLKHPNIVTIFDVNEEDGRPFIVMEFVHGKTLAEVVLSGDDVPLASKLDLIMELCEGLAFAHAAGIIHRDIKPSNMMVDEHGHLRILDFGIARPVIRDASLLVTDSRSVLGTSGYMAPETILGGQVDGRCDMFAAATVAYELLTFERPFGNGQDLGRRAVLGEIAPMKDIPSAIEAAVRKGLAPRPEDRYADMTAMRTAVADARASIGQRSPSVVEPSATAEGLGNRWIQGALGTAAVLVLAATMWFSMRGSTLPPAAVSNQTVQAAPARFGVGSANVDVPPTASGRGPIPGAAAASTPSPRPSALQPADDETVGKILVLPENVQRVFQVMTIALIVSAGVWLVSSMIVVMHRRAYNLTHVESARSQRIKPGFLRVDRDKRNAAAGRGAAYDGELRNREAMEAGAPRVDPSARKWPRRTASVVAVLSLLLTVVTSVDEIRSFQAGAESLSNWETLVALVGENKTGTLIALAVISANVALAVKKLQKP